MSQKAIHQYTEGDRQGQPLQEGVKGLAVAQNSSWLVRCPYKGNIAKQMDTANARTGAKCPISGIPAFAPPSFDQVFRIA